MTYSFTLSMNNLMSKVSLFPHPSKFSSNPSAYPIVVKSSVPSPGAKIIRSRMNA